MALSPGTHLGVFEIAQLIGAGGMGEVYRARDTKLGRDVAIKVLPETLAKDPKRLERFEREAQLLAALDHPNIGALYDFQESDGVHFLVLQLVEGETLAERIGRGPIPVDEALPIFAQIAVALEAAHDRGIVHRDLKPANIKITLDDRVKVLDFGIAKSIAPSGPGFLGDSTPTPSSPDATTMAGTPTPPWSITGAETFVGTPSYMSPEQARGKPVDKRSDIFAFGCCLYEVLTGLRTFPGETMADIISAITRDEPDWSRLPQNTPESLRNLLRRCLEKNPRRRLSGAGDIAITLEDAAESIKRDLQRPPEPESLQPAAAGAAIPAWAKVAGTLVALAVVAAIAYVLGRPDAVPGPTGTTELPPITSLAVLPFDNLMGDPEQEYFVDGMTDALSAELGKIRALKVISRSSAMRYKGTDKSLSQIAQELGVEGLVEGSILRSGSEVRITAQLIYAATDSHVWGESYDGTMANILALQKEVAMDIAKAIRVAVTPEEETRITTAKPVDPEAYEAYLRGTFFFWKFTPDGFEKAVESFQRAIELDPDFAEAHAVLGVAYWAPSTWGYVPAAEAVARARPAIDRALELDDTLAVAHVAAGWIALVFDWDWTRAEREFLRAIELNAGEPNGYHALAHYYRHLGRFDDAMRKGQEAIDLDPLNLLYSSALADTYLAAGRYQEAIARHQKVLELDPAYLPALLGESADYTRLSRYDEAIEVIEQGMTSHGRLPNLLGSLLGAHAAAGREAEAEALLAELHAIDRDEHVAATIFAVAYAALGDMDEAFHWIDKAIEDHDNALYQAYHPFWDPLRSDPRFIDMLRQINYPAIEEFLEAFPPSAAAVPDAIDSIAVLPFDNLTGDPEQEYFVDGMTETLVMQLAKIDGVRVVSRTSAMRYKGTHESIPTIARALGVDALVEGTVQRDGNTVRISARLIHGVTDEHLWADSYDGQLDNILSLQAKVALDIAKKIQIVVSPEDARRMLEQRAVDPEVHEAVLKGRFHWNKRTKEGFEQAAHEFQRAIELDPNYAPAHAGLADTYVLQAGFGHMRPLDIMPLAKIEAERAVELDPASAQGVASLALIARELEWDWDKAEELFLRAIELDPDYPTAHHWYGSFLYRMAGRLDEALAEAKLAHRLDPLTPIIIDLVAKVHQYRRDFAKAIEQYQYTLDMHPNFAPSLRSIVACYLQTGDYDSARPYLERLRANRSGSAFALIADARFLAAAGKREEATRIAAKALQMVGTTDFFMRTYLAMAFWEVGDDKEAFELLTEAVKERAGVVPFLLPANPWFDPMRGDPRFQALLDEMNLPPLPPDHPVAILNRQRKEDAATVPDAIDSIAVLPFDNLMGDPDQEYFVDGMTDALSAELGKIKALKVISRSSTMRYKGTDKSLSQIAQELGVEAIVEGSVFRAGDDVRITAQLIHVATDSHLLSENYTGTLENIFKLQGEVALAIAEAVRVALTPGEETRIASAKPVDPEAYEAYLRGKFFYWKFSADGFQKAVESFQQALALDPNFAEAHAWLGMAYAAPSLMGLVPVPPAIARARPEINKALALDDTLSAPHILAGYIALIFDWDWARAEREFLWAVEHNPGDLQGHQGLSQIYERLGRFDDALREIQVAIDLDPLNFVWGNDLANVYVSAGRYEDAIAQRQKVLEMDSTFLPALRNASIEYRLVSRYDDAVEVLGRAIDIHGRIPRLLAYLLVAHADAGRKAEAEALLAELQARAQDEYVGAVSFSLAYAALGDMDEAFRWLDRAVEVRENPIGNPYWPLWFPFRDDPRYIDVLRRMNYPDIAAFEARFQPSSAAADTDQNSVD